MSIFIAALALVTADATAASAPDVAMQTRIQQREAFAAREKIHAERLAEERREAPIKLAERQKIRSEFAAREKLHAERLAEMRASHSSK